MTSSSSRFCSSLNMEPGAGVGHEIFLSGMMSEIGLGSWGLDVAGGRRSSVIRDGTDLSEGKARCEEDRDRAPPGLVRAVGFGLCSLGLVSSRLPKSGDLEDGGEC